MSEPEELDFNLYHANAAAKIADLMASDVQEVSAYQEYDDAIDHKLIAFQFEMADSASPEDMGTEQWQADVRFVAFVIVPFTVENNERECRRIALKLAGRIYGQRFGCPIGPAKVITCMEDALMLPGKRGREGEAEEYSVFRVEWTHEAFIGPSIWDSSGDPPSIVIATGMGETVQLAEGEGGS